MITTALLAGSLTAIAILVVLFRTFSRRWIGEHALWIDIAASFLLGLAFINTITGIITAVVAGLIITIVLTVATPSRRRSGSRRRPSFGSARFSSRWG